MRTILVCLAGALFSICLFAQPTATSLVTSANPITFGQAVILTASVSPSSASGKVTFYDGVTMLGTKAVVGGQATLTTAMLPSGTRSLRAYFAGTSPSTSSLLPLVVNALAANGFKVPVNYYSSISQGFSIAVGDFNGDGKADLLVGNYFNSGGGASVDVMLGNGDGTFRMPVAISVPGNQPSGIGVGDFNGDGKADFAVTNPVNGTVIVFLGNGDGTFLAPVAYTTGGAPIGLAIGDFNGDGKADIVVANAQNGMNVLLGKGDGGFQASVNYATGSSTFAAVGDFNGDGKADIAMATAGNNQVNVLLGNGDGTFRTAIVSPAGPAPVVLVVGDFNGDGKADLALAGNVTGNNVSVIIGNGNGTFQAPVTYFTGAPAQWITTADFNGDGKPDLAVANQVYGVGANVSVLSGKGDGTFQTAVSYAANSFSATVAAGDFNGDGRADLAVSGTNLSILAGQVRPATSTTVTSAPNPSAFGQAVTLTANVSAASAAGTITFFDDGTALGSALLANGQTALLTRSLASGSHSITAAYSGDTNLAPSTSAPVTHVVNGGFPSTTCTLTASPSQANFGQSVTLTATISPATATGSVTFYDGTDILGAKAVANGRAVFNTSFLTTGARTLRAYCSGDANSAGSTSPPLMETVKTLPANSFRPMTNYATSSIAYGVAVGDFNGDGKADLAVATYSGLNILLGNGDGTFQKFTLYATGQDSQVVVVADFNGDGKSDLAVAHGNGVDILLGNGDGTFQPPTNYSAGVFVVSLAVADFNGDGFADLVLLDNLRGVVDVLPGNGNGTFQGGLSFAAGSSPLAVATGDFNSDGKTDLAVAAAAGIMLLTGNGDGTFQPAVNVGAIVTPQAITAADLNADGHLDLVVANSSNISVVLGNGDGTFQSLQPVVTFPVTNGARGNPLSVLAVDFNGDGKTDIVVASNIGAGDPTATGTDLSLLAGNGNGTFQQGVTYTGYSFDTVAAADFNGDGKLDLVAASPTSVVSVLLATNATKLSFSTQPANGMPGIAIPATVVQIQDAAGVLATGFVVPTVTLTSSPAMILRSAQGSGGVASFAGMAFDVTGTYTLNATSPGLLSATSNSFTITAVPPTVVIESPAPAAVLSSPNVTVSGWALDNITFVGSAIGTVQVLVDGTLAGTATYGLNRSEICASYPGRPGCPNVGFSFSLTLSPGTHMITVSATDTDGSPVLPETGSATVTVTVQGALSGSRAGVFRNNNSFLLDSNGTDVYEAGTDRFISTFTGPGGFLPGDLPVVGDWTGDGKSKVGIFRAGKWFLDANNNGTFDAGDFTYQFGGLAGDLPFVGDWRNAGKSCLGIYRPAGSVWLLDLNCNGVFEDTPTDAFFPFGGQAGDIPIVGAWTGAGTRVGVVRKYAPGGVPQGEPFFWVLDGGKADAGNQPVNHPAAAGAFAFGGLAGDVFVAGDWNNTGISMAGVYRSGFWVLDTAIPGAPQASHLPGLTFGYGGASSDVPLVGKW